MENFKSVTNYKYRHHHQALDLHGIQKEGLSVEDLVS
jgi:hypothetical protein